MYNEQFPNKTIFPVIHCRDFAQTLHNIGICENVGIKGVFLINHRISANKLLTIAENCKRISRLWIGANFLGLSVSQALLKAKNLDGVWSDTLPTLEDKKNAETWGGLLFGGVAFKYQPLVRDVANAAKEATSLMDVITTSGDGTGIAADINKISKMKKAIGDFPLAIASGITPENITNYLPFANAFLVATGISKNFENLDYDKLMLLTQAIKNVKQN